MLKPPELDSALLEVGEIGRAFFSPEDRGAIAEALWRIDGWGTAKSASHCICEADNLFVQFRVDFGRTAFRCEVTAHRFVASNSSWFTPGMLEDFVAALVPSGDILLRPVEEFLDRLPDCPSRFEPIHRPKARIHAWLAVQKEPGRPLGLAITNKCLCADSPCGVEFTKWFASVGGIVMPVA